MAKENQEKRPAALRPPRFIATAVAILLATVAFLVYVPSLRSDFVYDARTEILDEGFVSSLSNLSAILSLKVLKLNLMLAPRPGQMLYLMLNAAIWGKDPWGYHLVGNFLHAANVGLLYLLILRLISCDKRVAMRALPGQVPAGAAVAALLFGLHPLMVETVSAVNYSSDLLVTFFTLLALWSATEFQPGNTRVALTMGALGTFCALAAATCKESGVAVVPALMVYWFLYRRHEAKSAWSLFFGAASAVTLMFMAARFLMALPNPYYMGYIGGSFENFLQLQPRVWVYMLGKVIWPLGLSADYTLDNVSTVSPILAFAVLGLVLVLQIGLAWKSRLGALGAVLFWLGLATVSNFIPLFHALADRYYYLSLAGLAMQLVALFLIVLPSRITVAFALTASIVALLPLTVLSLQRQKVFANNTSLWTDTIRVSPTSYIAHNGLAASLLEKGDVNGALLEFQHTLKIAPDFDQALNNLGIVLLRIGKGDDAVVAWQKAVKSNRLFATAFNNLGNGLAQTGHLDEGIAQCRKAVELNPYFADAHYDLGRLLAQKGRWDEAVAEYRESLKIAPSDGQTHNNLGVALIQTGQADLALEQFREAVRLDPSNGDALQNLASLLIQQGQMDEAIGDLEKLTELRPGDALVAYNLGSAFMQRSRWDEAIGQFQATLKIDPKLTKAHNNLAVALYQKGEYTAMVAEFQEVVRLDPTNVKARENLLKAQAMAAGASPSSR